jgi:hypothetical protein
VGGTAAAAASARRRAMWHQMQPAMRQAVATPQATQAAMKILTMPGDMPLLGSAAWRGRRKGRRGEGRRRRLHGFPSLGSSSSGSQRTSGRSAPAAARCAQG